MVCILRAFERGIMIIILISILCVGLKHIQISTNRKIQKKSNTDNNNN